MNKDRIDVELGLDTSIFRTALAGIDNIFNNFRNKIKEMTLKVDIAAAKRSLADLESDMTKLKSLFETGDITSEAIKTFQLYQTTGTGYFTSVQERINETQDLIDELKSAIDTNDIQKLADLGYELDESSSSINNNTSSIKQNLKDSDDEMTEMTSKGTLLSRIVARVALSIKRQVYTLIASLLNPINMFRKTFSYLTEVLTPRLGATFKNIGNNLVEYVANSSVFQTLIKWILKVIYYAQGLFNIIAKMFGWKQIDLFKTSKKSAKEIEKSASKTVASFDELNVLSQQNDPMDVVPLTPTELFGKTELAEMQKNLEDIGKIFEDYEPAIKAAGIALGIFAGASMIKKLKDLIGTPGSASGTTGSGLSGVAAWLMIICGAASIGNTIKTIVQDISEINTIGAIAESGRLDHITNQTSEIGKLNEKLKENKERNKDSAVETAKLTKIVQQSTQDYKVNQAALDGSLSLTEKLFGANKQTSSEYQILSDRINLNVLSMQAAYEQGQLNDEQVNIYKETLQKSIDMLEGQNKHLDTNSGLYKTNTERIDDMKEALDKVNGYKAEAEVEVKAETKDFKDKIGSILGSVGQSILKTVLGFALPSSARITKWLNSFDVGTNYVPNDQLAIVHKGEAIIPKKFNDKEYFGAGNETTNALLETLIDKVDAIDFSPYIRTKDIGEASISYINDRSKIMGRRVV